MAVIRTRFIYWLIKAYIKRWGKLFLLFFTIGLIIFYLLLNLYPRIIRIIPLERKTIIGLSGTYTTDSIPEIIVEKVSRGLTRLDEKGYIRPDLANTWDITNNGKTYIFHLKRNIRFTDGTIFNSSHINYSFADVSISRPDENTIIFNLKNRYAPFLVTVTRPIFYKGYIGIGDFYINSLELNGNFLKSVHLVSSSNRLITQDYIFYPSNDALKLAFALGEVTQAAGLDDTNLAAEDLTNFPRIKINKYLNNKQLVTIFYNTLDPVLSDKKLRSSLSYAIPDTFEKGKRVYNPYFPASYYYDTLNITERKQDLNHARILKDSAMKSASMSAVPAINIKTLSKYSDTALIIKKNWEKIGLKIKIEEVDTIPRSFQVLLGDFNVPQDPDQYTLWHSAETNNITHFKNLRIDKLLEDGRETIDNNSRLKIYLDFQKYLLDESPASFLYFPYQYTLSKK